MSEEQRDPYLIQIRPTGSSEGRSLLVPKAELSDGEVRALIDLVKNFLGFKPRQQSSFLN